MGHHLFEKLVDTLRETKSNPKEIRVTPTLTLSGSDQIFNQVVSSTEKFEQVNFSGRQNCCFPLRTYLSLIFARHINRCVLTRVDVYTLPRGVGRCCDRHISYISDTLPLFTLQKKRSSSFNPKPSQGLPSLKKGFRVFNPLKKELSSTPVRAFSTFSAFRTLLTLWVRNTRN